MNALKFHLFVLLICFFTAAVAQKKTTNGRTLNDKTKQPVPFVTVSFVKAKVSTSADEKGLFKLELIENNSSDTLLFAAIGFKSLKLALKDLVSPYEVYLQEEVETLKEVAVGSTRKELEIGSFNITNKLYYLNKGAQISKRFEMPGTHQYLKRIIIRRDITYSNHAPETKFRVNIYRENPSTKGPGEKICMDTIEVHDLNSYLIRLDVSKYNITPPKSPFYIVVETLRIPYNERYRLTRSTNAREAEGDRNSAYYEVFYQPYLSIGHSRGNDAWYTLGVPGSTWKKASVVPAIKVIVN